MPRLIAAAAGLAAALTAGAALAQAPVTQDTYNFSYLLSTGVTDSGVFTGTLQSDNNTFDIAGVKSFSVDGVSYTGPLSVNSTDAVFGSGTNGPSATLDKGFEDYTVSSDGNYFVAAVGDMISSYNGFSSMDATLGGFGGDDGGDAFKPANYTASVTRSAGGGGGGPEPSTWALMMVGVFGVGVALRRGKGQPGFASTGLSPA